MMSNMSRRATLSAVPGLAATAAAAQSFDPDAPVGRASGLLDIGTPQMTLGPFYPMVRPHDLDADLTRIGRNGRRALGEVIDISGVVMAQDGRTPVAGAIVEAWQACASGSYNHPADPNPQPKDPHFQGFARLRTDHLGRFRFRTVMPGPYGRRAPHIHFDIMGRRRRLITQMLFAGHALNATDNVLLAVRDEAARVRALANLAERQPAGAPPMYWFPIVLAGE
jgi:protocatechuate 3,4-dioxygenase, beta subunit